MAARVVTSTITLLTTEPSVPVTARWAPMTSLLSRLTSAPVWVRVKNAIGMALHVVEQGHPQPVDEPLAHPGRAPALDDGEAGVGGGGHHAQAGQHQEEPAVLVGDGIVEDGAEQQRRHEGEQGGGHDGGQVQRDGPPIRPGELPRPPHHGAIDAGSLDLSRVRAEHHVGTHPHARSNHRAGRCNPCKRRWPPRRAAVWRPGARRSIVVRAQDPPCRRCRGGPGAHGRRLLLHRCRRPDRSRAGRGCQRPGRRARPRPRRHHRAGRSRRSFAGRSAAPGSTAGRSTCRWTGATPTGPPSSCS
jgi:hypothetical protein